MSGAALPAAADALGDESGSGSWWLTRSESVDRMALLGRGCESCDEERAVVEFAGRLYQWSGPGGERYTHSVREPTRVVENAPLVEANGGTSSKVDRDGRVFDSWWPARSDASEGPEIQSLLSIAEPEAIGDPSDVPTDPQALVAWVTGWLEQRREAAKRPRAARDAARRAANPELAEREAADQERIAPSAVSTALLDLATRAPLDAARRAAALAALAERPGAEVVPTPAAYEGDGRVAIRFVQIPAAAGHEAETRTVVLDRESHRIVGEVMTQAAPTRTGSRPTISLTDGGGPRYRMTTGSGITTTYAMPVAVESPGIDADGKRLLDPAEARKRRAE